MSELTITDINGNQHTIDVNLIQDDKYLVYKRSEVEALLSNYDHMIPDSLAQAVLDRALPDATVIRAGDVFAAPALYSYYNSIVVAIEVLRARGQQIPEGALAAADYFHQRAVQAENTLGKHLPD